jgi:hypothetical protein
MHTKSLPLRGKITDNFKLFSVYFLNVSGWKTWFYLKRNDNLNNISIIINYVINNSAQFELKSVYSRKGLYFVYNPL